MLEAARRPRQIAAARIGDDDMLGVFAELREGLLGNLHAECLDAANRGRRIERGIVIARLLEDRERLVEELRADTQLDDFRAEGLTGPLLLEDLRLSDAPRVIALLNDDTG